MAVNRVPFLLMLLMSLPLTQSLFLQRAWARPYTDADLRAEETPDEIKIHELRNEEIRQLRITLGRRSAQNRRGDLYFRLAEIYFEAYHYEFLLEGRVQEKHAQKAGVSNEEIDRSHSRPYLKKGVEACQEVINLNIAYPKLDQIYYFLGFNYEELGDEKQAINYLQQLTEKFPNSPYGADAYREMGDLYYQNQDYPKAQQLYLTAIRKSDKDTLARVLHKLAWIYYRTRKYDLAIKTMKEAVAAATQSGEKLLNLKEEALRDMAVFVVESGRVEGALEYFESVAADKSLYPKLLEALGRQYERNLQTAKAIQVYENLLKTHPESEAAFRVTVKLIELDLKRGHFREALARLETAKLLTKGEIETQNEASNLKATIRRTATEHHERYRQKADRDALELAELYYSDYIKFFLVGHDTHHESAEIQMYLAEVKRELGKSDEASGLYRKVLEAKDRRYAKQAGALWTASLTEAIHAQEKNGKKNATDSDPSPLEREYVEASDKLHDALGSGAGEAREASLKAAQVLAGYKNTQSEAIHRAKKIIDEDPNSLQAVTAARLWLQLTSDQLPQLSSLDSLKAAIESINQNPTLMETDKTKNSGRLKVFLKDLETKLKIGMIARSEKDNDFSSAAKGYEEFAGSSKGTELAEKAYANAIQAYLKADQAKEVWRMALHWAKRFPKSSKMIESIRTAATHLLIIGKFDTSADLFEKLGKESKDSESLETAARIFEGNGSFDKAQQVWTDFLKSYPNSPRRWSVALLLAKSYDMARKESEAADKYRYCANGPFEYKAECGARLADLHFRGKNYTTAKLDYRKVAKLPSSEKEGGKFSPFIGYARYRLGDIMERETKFPPFQYPEAKLKKALNQRLEFLEPLSRAFLAAEEAGGPWAIAALARLAAWATGFADEVDRIPPPSSASEAGVEKFKRELDSISGPLRKKALATWSDAYNRASSSEALSPVLPEIVDRLADAKLQSPGRAQGYHGRFRIAGVPADGGTDGAPVAVKKVRDRLIKNAQDASAWVDYGNLLWGEGKPILARLAYERALSLNSKNPAALNNRGVVALGGDGEEDWHRVAEAADLFQDALRQDEFFLSAKMNRAILLNYYRLFNKAKPLWDQILLKSSDRDVQDGLAIAIQGLGADQFGAAEQVFLLSTEAGSPPGRFAAIYHEAARISYNAVSGESGSGVDSAATQCLNKLTTLDNSTLSGFEKASIERLSRICTVWKNVR